MIRKLATVATAGALALGGLATFGAGAAGAATVITAGSGSNIHCTAIKAKATLAPALKDNWVKADHSSDPNVAFRAIPDTTFAANGPVSVNSSTKATSCTGAGAKSGATTVGIKEVDAALTVDPAHPGLANPATCTALVNMAPPAPTDTQYILHITYKSATKGFGIAPTTITDVSLGTAGAGFAVTGGTITGSFAGGTSNTTVSVDSKTLAAFVSSSFITTLNSSNAATAGKPCQASAKQKKGVWSLKAPKGVSKIGIASGSLSLSKS